MANTVDDWKNAVRDTYQGLPYSWRANFLQQPPMPWYNNASAQVPPAPAAPGTTPAATNATNMPLNQMAGGMGLFDRLISPSGKIGQLLSPAISNLAAAKGGQQPLGGAYGGLLNRLLMMARGNQGQ